MTEKLDIYDILSTIVLGVLLVCAVPVCFPTVLHTQTPTFPDAFAVIALTAVSWVAGQLVQALSSLTEPLLFRTFGGTPSERALNGMLPTRYLSKPESARIKEKLLAAMGDPEASNASVFRYATHRTEGVGIGRAARFNALYAYHRGLLTTVLLVFVMLVVSGQSGAGSAWSPGVRWGLTGGTAAVLVLCWLRTKQRGFYYAREILGAAERVLDDAPVMAGMPAETPPGKG
jgi:hypothetical protein